MQTQPSPSQQRSWRILAPVEADPRSLLDGGVELLAGLADDPVPMLRWYRATESALVLGRGQGALTLPGTGNELLVVTRHSGGGAVLLDPSLLNLDVFLPAGHPWLDEADLGAVFGHVGRAWANGLDRLGVPDIRVYDGPATARRRGTPREQLLAAVCYATLGRGEVLAGGRKLVGLSQRRRRPGALVQCGLLQRWDPAPLLGALGANPENREIHGAAIGLEELLPHPAAEATVRQAVEDAFSDAVKL